MRGPEQEKLPERQVEPTEVLGVALVLKVVKDRDLGTGAEKRRGETGIQHDVERMAQGGQRQHGLLPKYARRTRNGANGLRQALEVRLLGDQGGTGFPIRENEVLVGGIDPGETGQQAAQIDLGAADSARNQVQRVDADAQRRHINGRRASGLGLRRGRGARPRAWGRSPARAGIPGWRPAPGWY